MRGRGGGEEWFWARLGLGSRRAAGSTAAEARQRRRGGKESAKMFEEERGRRTSPSSSRRSRWAQTSPQLLSAHSTELLDAVWFSSSSVCE